MNLWLMLHIFGAILFVGNIITAAFWKVRAERLKNPLLIHHAVKNVMIADCFFTIPGIILIIISGIAMAEQAEMLTLRLNWLTLSLILFALTGIIWLTILIPLQRKMVLYSFRCIERGSITKEYELASRYWNLCGTAATLLPVGILYLMIYKGF